MCRDLLPIPIAPTGEQSRIVEKLDELLSDLDAGIASLSRVKTKLKRYRASVLKAAVEGKLTEEWRAEHREVEPASKLLERILAELRKKWEADQLARFEAAGRKPPKNWRDKYVEPGAADTAELPALPVGWCWATLEQLSSAFVDCAHRTPEYSEGGIPALRPRDVVNGLLDLSGAAKVSHEEYARQTERRVPQAGDIIYSRELSLGWGVAIPDNTRVCMSQGMVLFRPANGVNLHYLLLCVNGPIGRSQALAASTGSAHPHLNLGDIKAYALPLPPHAEQEHIVAEAETRLSNCDAVGEQSKNSLLRASRLRQSILERAFEGKLVPQDPNDEPASALLERIQAEAQKELASRPSRKVGKKNSEEVAS